VRAWEPASPEVMQRLRAWQSVRLVFDEQTLEEIVAQFNRSGPRRLIIGDARLKDLRIGGNFRSDNVDAFVRLLQLSFGIVGDEVGGEIVLRRPE